MARRRANPPLNVFLNGRHVGRLRRESTGAIDFQYTPEWLDLAGTFPVSLSLPLREDRYIGAPVINVFDKPPSKPLARNVARANGGKSKVRAAVEHVFARQKGPMELVVRTIGLARARVKIGLANLIYNMNRAVWLTGSRTRTA